LAKAHIYLLLKHFPQLQRLLIFDINPERTAQLRCELESRSRNGNDEVDRGNQRWLAQEKRR
jgi:hypothetical protein